MRIRARPHQKSSGWSHLAIPLVCFAIIATYVLMIDLKGISTDEGIRLAIINADRPFVPNAPPTELRWLEVLETGQPFAYQPLYFLLQQTVMSIAQTQNVIFLRLVNVLFLWLSIQGLLTLSKRWAAEPRIFLILLFSLNSYLFMHVLQIREYIVGVTFYIWSSWFTLHLLERRLGRSWPDCLCFAAYGALLTAGFYTQAWVVFPAIGQFLFLILMRKTERLHFYAHLAVSYFIAISITLPYLLQNRQKAQVGRWGLDESALLPQLSDGFHLVLSGHVAGHSWFTNAVFWFWILFLTVMGAFWWRDRPPNGERPALRSRIKHEATLMLLCISVSLAFQIGYFYKVENLSVWPRYFIIHYFFLTWLLALAFCYLHTLGHRKRLKIGNWLPRSATRVVFGLMLVSATYQIGSYYHDPNFDTGLSPTSNWRNLATGLVKKLAPEDTVLVHDLVNRATLTFTHPLTQPVLTLPELANSNVNNASRIVYLEPARYISSRPELAAMLAGKGYGQMEEVRLVGDEAVGEIKEWRLLVFRPNGS